VNETPTDEAAIVAEITAAVNLQRTESTAAAIDETDVIAAFDDLAPAGAVGDDGSAVIARLGAVSHINVDVPTGSNHGALVPVKKGLRKLQAWYLRYVVGQVNVALGLTVGALEDHEKRLRSLQSNYTSSDLGINPAPSLSPNVTEKVAELLAAGMEPSPDGAHLRTMAAWCGEGPTVAALVSRHIDAYGIDPDADSVSVALRKGLDVRHDDPIDHLGEIPAGSLAALVIGPAVDVMGVAAIAEILDLARRAVAEHGPIVIIADTEPIDAVRFELAERSPLSTDAWLRLMKARQLTDVSASSVPGDLTVFTGRN